MGLIVGFSLGSWFLITALCQFPGKSSHLAYSVDWLGLIPRWTFFAPSPISSDYYIVFREFDKTGVPEGWIQYRTGQRAGIFSIIWNPSKRPLKALLDCVFFLLEKAMTGNANAVRLDTGYLLLLGQVSNQPRLRGISAVQFAVVRKPHVDANDHAIAFLSDIHSVDCEVLGVVALT